ncbi:hypothetical protein ES706_01862 [subsurface metagenome]
MSNEKKIFNKTILTVKVAIISYFNNYCLGFRFFFFLSNQMFVFFYYRYFNNLIIFISFFYYSYYYSSRSIHFDLSLEIFLSSKSEEFFPNENFQDGVFFIKLSPLY